MYPTHSNIGVHSLLHVGECSEAISIILTTFKTNLMWGPFDYNMEEHSTKLKQDCAQLFLVYFILSYYLHIFSGFI